MTRPVRGAKTVECPVCGAPAGEPCRRSATSPFRKRGGATVSESHHRRVELAREAGASAPATGEE
jgi:hypothetical protein